MKKKEIQLQEHLSSLSKEELIGLLVGLAEEYDAVKKDLSIKFVETGSKDSLKQFKAIIKASIRQYSERGFVFNRNVHRALTGAYKVMEAADSATAKGQHLVAAEIILCVLHEMSDFLQKCDDSGGDVGGIIKEGLEHLQTSASQGADVDSKTRSALFNSLLKAAAHSDWDGWNEWRLSLMETASLWMDSPSQREKWWKLLQDFEDIEAKSEYQSKYFAEEAAQLRYAVLARFDGAEKAHQFLEEHLEITEFRETLIDKAVSEGRFDDALSLIQQGEIQDKQRGYPGLVEQWEKKRAVVYESSGDLGALKVLARKRTLQGDYEFYLKLKEMTDVAEWETQYESLLDEIEQESRSRAGWHGDSLYIKLIIQENRTERLLNYLKQNDYYLIHYYKHLIDSHPSELHMLFVKRITNEAKAAENRKEYSKVCDLIKHLIAAGGREHAEELIGSLRQAYPKRVAFLDELDKIRLT